jgi:type I restriction enzyme S subunit
MREGWERKKIIELTSKLGDGLHGTPKYSNDGDYFFINGNNLDNGQILIKEQTKKVTNEEYEKYKKDLNDRTVFVSINGTLGNVAYYNNEKIILGKSACYFNLLEGIEKDFIKYTIQSPNFIKYMFAEATGATIKNFSLKSMRDYEIELPPLPEQKQIVAILDQAFTAIDQAKANIERNMVNAKELFQSKKEFLFDALSKECKVLPIESVCEQIFAGGDAPKENFSKEKTEEFSIPIIANAVKDNGLYGYTNAARVHKHSITVAARGSGTGHTEFRDYPFVPIVRLIVLTPDTTIINAEFLMHAIKNLIIERSGSAIPQLTVPMMKSYSIPVPDIDKQTDINKSLNQIELQLNEYKAKLTQKLSHLEELKKSILQKAFAGELTETFNN